MKQTGDRKRATFQKRSRNSAFLPLKKVPPTSDSEVMHADLIYIPYRTLQLYKITFPFIPSIHVSIEV